MNVTVSLFYLKIQMRKFLNVILFSEFPITEVERKNCPEPDQELLPESRPE